MPKTMTTFAPDGQQQRALDVDLEIDGVTLAGASGSGKTTVLIACARRHLEQAGARVLALTGANVEVFRTRLREECSADEFARITVCTPLQFALMQRQLVAQKIILNAYEAQRYFTRAAAPLLDVAWPELMNEEIDPEVSGLRSPERFLDAAFRIMMKLLASNVDPLTIEESALRATTQFYARPPNFADAELLRTIKEEHRSSLRVDRTALEYQCRREIDLTRIVVKLFHDFAHLCNTENRTTEAGFLQMLTAQFTAVPAQAEIVRRRFRAVVIDDAQDILATELTLLKAIWGEQLTGVMLAGDIQATMMSFGGARPQETLSATEQQIILHERRRGTRRLVMMQQGIFPHPDAPALPCEDADDAAAVVLERSTDAQAQAETIAAFIGEDLSRGKAPAACAVAMRTLRCSAMVIEALLAHDIPVDCAGDIDFASDAATLDFVALLRTIVVPEQHPEAVLRLLSSKMLNLSDRSIAILASPAQDPMLFQGAEPSSRGKDKGDRTKHFIENVFRGINDHALGAIASRRLETFRSQVERWHTHRAAVSLREFLIDVATESGLISGSGVRGRFSRNLICRVIADLTRAETASDLATLITSWTERTADSENAIAYEQVDPDAVCVASVTALRGRAFTSLAVADARAGAFPRYYVPNAMLYSPQRGFIGRENAGSMTAARTAKFTWYFEKSRVREAYNDGERRIFAYTLARATDRILVTAWGPATRGRTAPEFLEELRALKKHAK